MNKFTFYGLSAAAILLLAASACTHDELTDNTLPEGEYPLIIEATGLSVAATTRATVDGNWDGVQTVGLKVDNEVKEYNVNTFGDNTSATLSSDDPHYWTSSEDITVTAWWPYSANETEPPVVKVQADQSLQKDFAASDFISAVDKKVKFDSPTLTFSHRTARITIKLTEYTTGLTSVKLTNLSTDGGNPDEIVPYEYDEANFIYVALVAPQFVEAGTTFISCEFNDGKTLIEYKMQNEAEWKAGEEYTYTVSLAEAGPDYIYNQGTNTYTVYTAKGLLVWNVAAQDDPSTNCTLARDINWTDIEWTGSEWTPIGSYSSRFTGIFEGGDYTITGLTIDQEDSSYVGLIGYLGSGGKVQNLTLNEIDIKGNRYVGGVVGTNYYGTVTNCSASGTVSGSGEYVGGVVGMNFGTVTDCTSSGSVSGAGCIGGVVGTNYGGTVTASYSLGRVDGDSNVGGVAGYNGRVGRSIVTACYHASGTVSGSGEYVGGVVGDNHGRGIVTTCYWSSDISEGIGYDYNDSGDVTKVDGDDVTWEDAVDEMNKAIDAWNEDNTANPDKQCDWEYVYHDENTPPTLTKK